MNLFFHPDVFLKPHPALLTAKMVKVSWTNPSIHQFEDSFYICSKYSYSSLHLHAGDS